MEKVVKSRNKVLKLNVSKKFLRFLPPRAAPAIIFPTNSFSPKRSDVPIKPKSHLYKGFSGPIISIVPEEARKKIYSSSFRAHEPTSPKVSCMGQIKMHKKKTKNITKDKHVSLRSIFNFGNSHCEAKRKASGFGELLGGAWTQERKFNDSKGKPSMLVDRSAPSLGQIKRLPSRRNSLPNYDWTAQIATPVDGDDDLDYFSDEESEGEEKEVLIPFSAPIILVGGGGGGVALVPKKEINLWKRRTMPQPRPLQVS